MVVQASIAWDEGFTTYNFGTGHPMDPVRLSLTARLCELLGLLDPGTEHGSYDEEIHAGVELISPEEIGDDRLARVHDRAYIEAVKRASDDPSRADPAFGIGTDDDPAFVGMHESSARIADATRAVAEQVWTGRARHGVNFTGGLHHAMRDRAAGFCIYNDAAFAIDWLLANGAERVAYVDVDAHHGDGVQEAFWDDPRVLTISVHETGKVLFPGTGFPREVGAPGAEGAAANVALPPGTDDTAWLRAIDAVVPALLRAFRPQILISQHGADSHYTDPLAHLAVSVDAQRQAMEQMHDLAHRFCDGKWVGLGGGGYQTVTVVPRIWTHLVGIAAHRPVDLGTALPQEWCTEAAAVEPELPAYMGDGLAEGGRLWFRSWDHGYDPENKVDAAVQATREAVFPHLGLDVWFD